MSRKIYPGYNPFQGFQNHIHSVFPKQQHNRPPYNGPNPFSCPGPNPFSGPTIQPPDIWKQLQQNNLPEGSQPNIFPPTFPQSQKTIFDGRNPFSGPTIQPPDKWIQLQQNNLPEELQKGPPIFPPPQYYNFPKKF
jgi:hypothetical protein